MPFDADAGVRVCLNLSPVEREGTSPSGERERRLAHLSVSAVPEGCLGGPKRALHC
jgi:hypothetical protein